MSIETVEIRAFSGPSVVEINGSDQPSIVEVNQGPAGAAGPNSVTSATTSDGTANLSLSNVTTATATVTGTLTADHIHGNLAGSVYAHVRAGENLLKGDPVYVSGSHGTGANLIAIVSKADASDPLKMPAVGVMDAAVTANANGHMVITGTISDINTATYSVNAELYVAEGGGFTATPPNAYAQPVARVERSNTNNGAIIVKVNGLSATDATISTLVRRDSTGSASFFSSNHLSSISIGSNSLTATPITGGALFFNDTSEYAAALYSVTTTDNRYIGLPDADGYVALTDNTNGVVDLLHGGTNATTAPDARTNLGLGTSSSPTFSNLTLTSGTITTSQPFSLTQTWNASAVTFRGISLNVTDTASGADSYLIDLQADASSKFRVTTQPATGTNNDGFRWEGNSSGGIFRINVSGNVASIGQTGGHDISLAEGGLVAFRNVVGGGVRIGTSASGPRLFAAVDLDHILEQRNATNPQVFRLYNTRATSTDYHRVAIATVNATATAMTGATVTLTNLIPKGAVVVGVTCKVTTLITGATSFNIGTAADADRFGAGIAVAAGTTSDNTNWTAGTIECFTAATSIILTAVGSNFTAGAVYVSVQYLAGQAD